MSRPADKWDIRFLKLAQHVGQWSKDPSTKCGAVIVRPDRTICSVGYNGFPRGMDDSKELLEERAVKYSRTVHCEMNAVLHAREPLEGYTLYTAPCASCDRCAVHMIQCGIKRFVFPTISGEFAIRWAESMGKTFQFFKEAGCSFMEMDSNFEIAYEYLS